MTNLRFLLRSLAIAFIGSLLVAPLSTSAPLPSSAPANPPTLIKHLRTELQSSDPVRREAVLIDIATLASCNSSCTVHLRSMEDRKLSIENETGIGTVVELDALIPDLHEAYRSGPADGHRLVALAALINIGNEKGLEKLVEEGAFRSKRVNSSTQRSLAAFYLETYPELAERTLRTGQLSLDDVHRAKVLRLKKAKKAAKQKDQG